MSELQAISDDVATQERFCKVARRLAATLRRSYEPYDPSELTAKGSLSETVDGMGRLIRRIETNLKESA